MAKQKIVLAYSGGLDTSVAIKWLQEEYNYDVVAVTIDVGEGSDLKGIKQKALDVGAISAHVINAVEPFANEYILPALQSNLLYEAQYPLATALARPLIAKLLVDIAEKEGAVAIAHGCTGKGNDQVRFDVSIKALNPALKIVAPMRENPMAREDAMKYAEKHGIPITVTKENPYSVDQNLWGRSCECGALEDPWNEPPEGAFDWTNPLENTPNEADIIDIEFHQGKPIALNGKALPFHQIIEQLNATAGKHGIGRIDMIENRLVGIKSREIYEAPGAITLINAHRALEALTLPRETAHFKPIIELQFAKMVYEGLWFSPLIKAICDFIKATQISVNGTTKVKLFKGQARVVARKSPTSLYKLDLATYDPEDSFDHEAAQGFIKLWGLPLEVYASVNKAKTQTEESVI